MLGRRVYPPAGTSPSGSFLHRADYALIDDNLWALLSPEGTLYVFPKGDPAVHEHEDGTVTVSDRLVRGEWKLLKDIARGK